VDLDLKAKQASVTGRLGEQAAADYLLQRGYNILAKNERFSAYEVDLIALNDLYLVFVEVKTRENVQYGKGFEHVSYAKQKRVIHSALRYRMNNRWSQAYNWRFDIISVTLLKQNVVQSIQHFKNAFTWNQGN
jgi:putative endonuclease